MDLLRGTTTFNREGRTVVLRMITAMISAVLCFDGLICGCDVFHVVECGDAVVCADSRVFLGVLRFFSAADVLSSFSSYTTLAVECPVWFRLPSSLSNARVDSG